VAVAVVGSRAATRDDAQVAFDLAQAWAARDHLIVSGGALGIDAAAHRGALAGGGPTVAVLGAGLDVIYPARHGGLFTAIVGSGGALVSMFAHRTQPKPGHFVARNALIAGLADAVVVVAASASSGALHTARAAHALGRPVLAAPGTPGCDRLIAAGAGVCTTADDLDRALAGAPRRPVVAPVVGDAAAALAALTSDGRDAETLAQILSWSAPRAAAALFELELLDLAIALPGRKYVRSTLTAPQVG
jgi:DNA processing protein